MKTKPEPAPLIRTIRPNAVFFMDDLRRLFRFGRDTLTREHRAGRLRVACRCGRLYVLGKWLLQWIEAGEIRADGQSGYSDDQKGR